MNRRKLLIRVGCYITIVLALFFALKLTGIKVSDLSADTILAIAQNNIIFILLIMLFIMILQNLFTFIPLVLVITVNISLLGFWFGYLFSCLCSVIGSTLIFLSIRYMFPNLFSHSRLKMYEEKIKENGFRFVLFGRIFPFLPTNLINITSGLSSIKLSHFIAATTLGNMIYGLVLSSASISVIAMFAKHPYLTSLGLIVIILLYISFLLVKKKKSMAI